MFRRRRGRHGDRAGDERVRRGGRAHAAADQGAGPGADPGGGGSPEPGLDGPYDAAEAPDDQVNRLDLGGLLVPALPAVEVRMEADPSGGVSSVLLVSGDSALQIGAFAAPRGEGIWNEVRAELRDSVAEQGGTVRQLGGEFGEELYSEVPGQPGEGLQPIRFVGVDGPRWFLRAVYHGRAALDPTADPELTDSLRLLVVVRGANPMPVRDPLPLRLPKEIAEEQARRESRAATPTADGPDLAALNGTAAAAGAGSGAGHRPRHAAGYLGDEERAD
jgi:hypothetical protein